MLPSLPEAPSSPKPPHFTMIVKMGEKCNVIGLLLPVKRRDVRLIGRYVVRSIYAPPRVPVGKAVRVL